jgi:hypothetical protein
VPPTRPSDFAGGDAWKLTSDQSGNPTIDARPAELFGVTGMSVDKAWQVSTGRPDVLIAVLDSGIRWDDAGAMADLARKGARESRRAAAAARRERRHEERRLNPDPYDLDDDGAFTAADYANVTRVGDRNANGVIDPQDLIRAFSDGIRRRRQRLRRRRRRLEFPRRRQRPVRRGRVQPRHRRGARLDGGGGRRRRPRRCPSCMVLPIRVGDSFIADSNLFAQAYVFAVDSGVQVIQRRSAPSTTRRPRAPRSTTRTRATSP